MKVSLAMVTSADGKSTQGATGGTMHWVSPEDQSIFQDLIASHDIVVMGSATYKSVRNIIKPSKAKPRLVLTRAPKQFEADAGRPGLSFSTDTPGQFMLRATKAGYENILLVGGSETNARFFDSGLVNEIWLTIEPSLFGEGLPFSGRLKHTISLQLLNCRQLNKQGTLLLHYLVKPPEGIVTNEDL